MDKISKKIVNGLDKVEGSFLGKDIHFLAVDINEVPDLQVASVPSLIYFKNGDPIVYEENLMNEEAIRTWVDSELKSNLDVIEDLNQEQIHDLMDENEYVMVYLCKFMKSLLIQHSIFLYLDTQECEACDEAIKQLEQIDDDADAVGVKFVKTDEKAFADEYGIENFPTIIYFEGKQPSIYDGDPAEETELLTWMLYQMKEDTVENINKIEAKPFILCNLHKARSGAQAHKKGHSGRTTFEVPKRKIRTVFVIQDILTIVSHS